MMAWAFPVAYIVIGVVTMIAIAAWIEKDSGRCDDQDWAASVFFGGIWPLTVLGVVAYHTLRPVMLSFKGWLVRKMKGDSNGHREATEGNRGGAAETGVTVAASSWGGPIAIKGGTLTASGPTFAIPGQGTGESPSVEPELVVGPLIAYRVWTAGYGGTLRSTGVGGLWKPDAGFHSATCRMGGNHAVPDWECGCGYWCFKEPWDAIEQGGVCGSLLVQGRCIEATKGYRAEQAQITAFCRLTGNNVHEEWWEGAEELYDVPVFTSIKKFIEHAEAARD